MKYFLSYLILILIITSVISYEFDKNDILHDPNNSFFAYIDRFSNVAGHLWRRSVEPSLPAPNQPIDFDNNPFFSTINTKQGKVISFYDFDQCSNIPSKVYVLYRQGENSPVKKQLPIFQYIPGNKNYNDFCQEVTVIVPNNYVANSVASVEDIYKNNYKIILSNCALDMPIVPKGSTANIRLYSSGISKQTYMGWFNNQVVCYFLFNKQLNLNNRGQLFYDTVLVENNNQEDYIHSTNKILSNLIFFNKNSSKNNWLLVDNANMNFIYCPLLSLEPVDDKSNHFVFLDTPTPSLHLEIVKEENLYNRYIKPSHWHS